MGKLFSRFLGVAIFLVLSSCVTNDFKSDDFKNNNVKDESSKDESSKDKGSIEKSSDSDKAAEKNGIKSKENTDKEELISEIPEKVISTNLSPDMLYHYLLAEIAIQRKMLDEAFDSYYWIMENTSDQRLIRRFIRVALSVKKYNEAEEGIEKWKLQASDNPEPYLYLMKVALAQKDIPKAATNGVVYIEKSEEGFEKAFNRITLLLSYEREVETSFQTISKIRDRYINDPYANYSFAEFAYATGRYQEAIDALKVPIKANPKGSKPRSLLLSIVVEMEDKDAAQKSLKDLIDENPENIQLRLALARFLVSLEQYEEAAEQMKMVLDKGPKNVEALLTVAPVFIELGKYMEYTREKLLDALREGALKDGAQKDEAAKGESGNEKIYYLLGRVDQKMDKKQEAIDWYWQVTTGKQYLESRYRIAMLLAENGKIDESQEALDDVIKTQPDMYVQAVLMKSEILRDAKEYGKAISLLTEELSKNKENTDFLYARAMLAERADNIKLLEDDLRAIMAIDPKHAHAINALGYTLADRTDRYDEAKKLIEQAYLLKPDDAAIIDSMGWINYKLGDYKVAETYLRMAIKIKNDPEILLHLIEVLWAQDKKEEAQKAFEIAKKEFPDHHKVKRIIDSGGKISFPK